MKNLLLAAATAAALVVIPAAWAAGSTTGTARVFLPNPVAELQDQTLTDRKDADYTALQPAYRIVGLTNLDGSGRLCGDWACVYSETGNPAFSPTNTFRYDRHQDEFEQAMAYYWITESQKYIQSLGFGVWRRPVDMQPQLVRLNQLGYDNSFATTKPRQELRFGKGGVDDAEDAEVILHEYGHAIHFSQNFGFGGEGGAISEGFGDYWAATVSDHIAPTPDEACIADWDSVSYTSTVPHCLRRVDTNLHYPEDLSDEVHRDGRIWSRALWDIRAAVGPTTADTAILEGSFDFPGTTMTDLANRTVSAAQRLYGNGVALKVRRAFEARGIL